MEESILRKPKQLKLYGALKIGYMRDEEKQAKALKQFGYVLDKSLTNREHLTAYDPVNKKLLFIPIGTQPSSMKDIGTDINLAFGRLKETERYKDDKRAFNDALAKYNEDRVVLAGHSLGGTIASGIGRGQDRIISLNKGATVGAQTRNNEEAFRIRGDVVSVLGSGIKTIQNPNLLREIPVLGAHTIEKIRNTKANVVL
jgi:hypothetical protein